MMATAVLPTLEEALNPAPRLRSKVEVVTPEIAARWLERNEANRIVHQGTVEKYARDMKSGETWLAYNLKAMNQWREKRNVRVLQVKPGEPMPELWR